MIIFPLLQDISLHNDTIHSYSAFHGTQRHFDHIIKGNDTIRRHLKKEKKRNVRD